MVTFGGKRTRIRRSRRSVRKTRSRRGGDDVESGHGQYDAMKSMEEGRSPSPPMFNTVPVKPIKPY